MFTGISWATYAIMVAIALIAYYFIIVGKYYSEAVRRIFNKRRPIQTQEQDAILPGATTNTTEGSTAILEQAAKPDAPVEELTEALIAFISFSPGKNYSPQDLKKGLQLILQRYPAVRDAAAKTFIEELIISQSEKYHSIMLTSGDVALLWKDEA